MVIHQIENLNFDIYQGNFEKIDEKIISVIANALEEGVTNQTMVLEIIKIVEHEITKQNYVYIIDLLKYELKNLLINQEGA